MTGFCTAIQRTISVSLLIILCVAAGRAAIVRGTVTDSLSGEPLAGASVQIEGTSLGGVTDTAGVYSIQVGAGTYTVRFRYIGYKEVVLTSVRISGTTELNVQMSDAQILGAAEVRGRKNLEAETALLSERKQSTTAIENIGAKEMTQKGLSNVEEGVKKITGISVADAGQIIVRGLGDRYSSTTLNGLPIASPNPDNKLIPLDIFPSSTVQNITVSKVYEAEAFADYSGAHIDISTKENVAEDFFNVSANVGGAFNTLGKDYYQMDRDGSLLKTPSMDQAALDMTLTEFDEYVLDNDIFNTSFDVKKKTRLPNFGASIGWGKKFTLWGEEVSILAAGTANHKRQIVEDAYYKTLNTAGVDLSNFSYDGYTESLDLAGLACLQTTLRKSDRVGYTFFIARDATDTYQLRTGTDEEGNNLTGINDVTHIYTLMNHQLNGVHYFGAGEQWELRWSGSYSDTGSDEPDRRQVMFVENSSQTLSFFKLNRQETMRYYGELDETEWNGAVSIKWKWREGDFVKAGFNIKDKDRDYFATRFYYNVNKIYDTVDDIYSVSDYINQSAVSDGTVVIERKMQPKDSYLAGNTIYAGFLTTDYHFLPSWLLNVGVRYEYSKQWVRYATDGGERYSSRRDLNGADLFPTLNLKYSLTEQDIFRFSVSRTVTRPSFIEMAPFLYQESYGSAQIRGNADLENGYNYNIDLRYERFNERGDMISATVYFKYLDSPIERVQSVSGGATTHTFYNASHGTATGVEVEVRKTIIEGLRLGANVSYMYTDVKLPEGGAYTNKERALQGASPILVNCDATYTLRLKQERQFTAALLYNLQGRRIQSVGVNGLGDVKQQTVHTLNANVGYDFNRHWSVKAQVKDLLNRAVIFKQDVPTTGEEVEVERYKKGTAFEVGFTYKL